MMRRLHRWAAAAVLLACSSATMGCAESDENRSAQPAEVETSQPPTSDSPATDISTADDPAADSLAAHADPDSVGPPELPLAAPTPTAVRRAPARPPAGEASVAAVVHGIAELQIDETRFVPADYLRVVLRGGAPVKEALTSAGGEFFFENVPAGRYQLVFLTVTKDARQVYATPVRVESGDRMRLPPVHIPIDSVRSRKY